jgi:hypothetical protein
MTCLAEAATLTSNEGKKKRNGKQTENMIIQLWNSTDRERNCLFARLTLQATRRCYRPTLRAKYNGFSTPHLEAPR